MQEKITIFHTNNSPENSSKLPLSPYGDKTFIFETHEVGSNIDFFRIMVPHFILNIPLSKQTKPFRSFRRKTNLESVYGEYISYLILDVDDVESESAKNTILEYFKDYKVILGQSKSYNGIDNFNMKGVLFTENIAINDAKLALSSIYHDLKDCCTIDESVTRRATYNAPISKNEIFINNEDGQRYKFIKREAIEHINEVKREYVGGGVEINVDELQDIEADSIEKLCLKVFQSMGFQAIKNNPNESITFKHPVERKTPGGYFWFSSSPYTMHHNDSTKAVNIFDTIRKLDIAKELMKKEINYDSEFLEFNVDTSVITVNEKYLTVSDKVQNSVQEFLTEKGGLFSIRSPMGTGKSTIIKHIIEECHDQDMKVLIITNRISVAQDFGRKYSIKLYNEDKYEIGDSLVCQYDSLWKYNIKYFDIVIMDEFLSLMMHARSNLNNNSVNIAKFFACFNKKLVIADAFLTGYENFLLSGKNSNMHLVDNIYRDPTLLYSYDNFNKFVDSIIVHSDKHKVTISSTSLNFIKSLQLLLTNRGKKVVTLTADTQESTKELIYGLFEEEDHDKWDVLIYSPTLTVGVSNLNNVPYHFHHDSSISTDVISSIQMIKRTRKSKEIHMFIKDRVNYLKTSYNDIRDEYMGNIGKNIEQNYLFDVDDYGEARLSYIGKNAIKIDTFKNILEFNHKAAMMWMLKYHFMKEPRVITDKLSSGVLMKYQKQIKEDNNSLIKNNIQQFLTLNDMEKTNILLDNDGDKIMKVLADIDGDIKECPPVVKTKILECAMSDKKFINKCKYYKVAFNFTHKIYDVEDIKSLVSKSVVDGKNDDLHFYNSLLSYGQNEIFSEYDRGVIAKNKQLKYILDKCGYTLDTMSGKNLVSVGHRGYRIKPEVKELYGYVK